MSTPYRTILTGANGGIGLAMANVPAPVSSSLLLLGRNQLTLGALANTLSTRNPTCAVSILAGDLSQHAYLEQVAEHAHRMQTNLLINNAGIHCFGSTAQTPLNTQHQVINCNLWAPMQLTGMVLPTLLKQNTAQVIQVGSVFGYIGYPGNAAYCASKFGLRGYSQALARELANTPVRVKYFAPRATQTPLNSDAINALNTALNVATDTPEDVAQQLPIIQTFFKAP